MTSRRKIQLWTVSAISILCCSITLQSQGFDWRYSYRLPGLEPRMFVGFGLSGNFFSKSGNLCYCESSTPCAKFTTAESIDPQVQLVGEWWMTGKRSFQFQIAYQPTNSMYLSDIERLPIRDGRTAETQYQFETVDKRLSVALGLKQLIYDHWWACGGIQIISPFSSSSNLRHLVLSPDDYYFGGVNQLKSVVLNGDTIARRNRFTTSLQLKFGKDVSVANGMYLAPSISFVVPVGSTISNSDLKESVVSFGVDMYFGLP